MISYSDNKKVRWRQLLRINGNIFFYPRDEGLKDYIWEKLWNTDKNGRYSNNDRTPSFFWRYLRAQVNTIYRRNIAVANYQRLKSRVSDA